MKLTFKNIPIIAVLLSFSVSCYAGGGKDLLPALRSPSKSAEIKAVAASDREAAALLTAALRTDKDSDSRCAAIEALVPSRNESVSRELVGLLSDPDSSVRSCAIRAAGESKNELAAAALLANIERYQASARNMGPYENNIKDRLKAIDSIWSLGEIGDPVLMAKLSKFYAGSDDVIRMNLIISMGKLKKNTTAGPYIEAIAASANESEAVRATAFEMLAEIGWNTSIASLAPSKYAGIEKADLIYTGGKVGTIGSWGNGDLPVGHTGIFAGAEVKNGRINVIIMDCVLNSAVPGGVRNIYSWKNFTHQFKYPYYGNRTTSPKPTAAQRDSIVKMGLAMGKMGLKYDNTHLSQKGPVEFDCVGYTEYLYEKAGLNPTDNSYESGLGWPLTPWEQFDSTRPNLPPREVIIQDNRALVLPPKVIKAPDRTIIKRNFEALTGAFGIKAVQPANVSADIQPEAAN
ncbi:MAG: HEAT repeat domain-containing protein [Elusimicrobia bacterium]|nr:HEAT repeat domain-containing protein [Elusimicrobiota bacterium]